MTIDLSAACIGSEGLTRSSRVWQANANQDGIATVHKILMAAKVSHLELTHHSEKTCQPCGHEEWGPSKCLFCLDEGTGGIILQGRDLLHDFDRSEHLR